MQNTQILFWAVILQSLILIPKFQLATNSKQLEMKFFGRKQLTLKFLCLDSERVIAQWHSPIQVNILCPISLGPKGMEIRFHIIMEVILDMKSARTTFMFLTSEEWNLVLGFVSVDCNKLMFFWCRSNVESINSLNQLH